MAIFGFVAIRYFIDATEILQENVMVFSNEIAEIVHSVCDQFHGATNKNLGDCFLMIWKFKDENMLSINDKDEVTVKNFKAASNYIDQTIVGLLKTLAQVTKLQNNERFVSFFLFFNLK